MYGLSANTLYPAVLRPVQTLDRKLDSNDPVAGAIEDTIGNPWA